MERYGEYMSDGNMMPAFQLVKSKSRRRCRKDFNVVPAQALMELFLSEEGLIHKRLHGNVIHLIHLIQNEIYLSLKGICDMNEIGHKSHRSHRGQNRVRTESVIAFLIAVFPATFCTACASTSGYSRHACSRSFKP